MDTNVRRRQPDDLDACGAALAAVYESDGYPVEGTANAMRWLNPAGLLGAWVAELDHHIVGHVAVSAPQVGDDAVSIWLDQSTDQRDALAVLGRLFVLRSARGHSLGERLVRSAMADATSRDLRLVLDVMRKDEAAIRLYERLGWRQIGTAAHIVDGGQHVPAYCYVAPKP